MHGLQGHGWHTAIETAGFAGRETLERILPFRDIILACVKPCHRLGQEKYGYLCRDYRFDGVVPLPRNAMEGLKSLVESFGLRCSIGGSQPLPCKILNIKMHEIVSVHFFWYDNYTVSGGSPDENISGKR